MEGEFWFLSKTKKRRYKNNKKILNFEMVTHFDVDFYYTNNLESVIRTNNMLL